MIISERCPIFPLLLLSFSRLLLAMQKIDGVIQRGTFFPVMELPENVREMRIIAKVGLWLMVSMFPSSSRFEVTETKPKYIKPHKSAEAGLEKGRLSEKE